MMYSSVAALATVALTATHAAAFGGFSDPRFKFSEHSGGLGPSPPQGSPSSTHSTKTTGAVVYCTSSSWAGAARSAHDSYEVAVATAIADVCAPGFDGSDFDLTEVYGWAKAYAAAAAEAQATCFSAGNGGYAKGCAYSDAHAAAWAEATAEIHAAAAAEAIAKHCVYPCADASSWSFGHAFQVTDIIAQAHAEAASKACVAGNDFASAYAYADCYAKILAHTYGKAVAEAAADAGCYNSATDANAATAILAAVTTTISKWEVCEIDAGQTGPGGDSFSDGGAFNFDFDVTDTTH